MITKQVVEFQINWLLEKLRKFSELNYEERIEDLLWFPPGQRSESRGNNTFSFVISETPVCIGHDKHVFGLDLLFFDILHNKVLRYCVYI